MIHQISAEHLTIERIGEIIEKGYKLELSEDARKRIVRCREYLDKKIEKTEKPIYGVTTGFGSLCNVSIGNDQLSQLQINLMMSHACGTGDRVPNDIVKIMLLLKIQSLSYGYSGCKLDTVERLVDFFNNDVYPIVYMQGSLGASGDLVPLAHLCLPLVGLGDVEYKGKVMTGAEMLKENGWEPIQLGSKEGLALLNGTQNMSSFAVWALLQGERLSKWADKIAAMSLDAYYGLVSPFTDAVHQVRPHKGQIETAANMRQLLEGSEIIEKPTFDILGRIERERLSRGWSEYALAENSGLTQSTISTWRRRNLQPNVASLEKICSGLGISLSQFFQEEDSVYLTPDQKEILDLWAKLSPAQRTAVSQMLRSFLYIKEEV